mmetsp:Transcript_20129/g.62857  ORF Transcript_20129/g.62857 Transcript_20129/m.62857 type:complete len:603 (-) Transcript_20129:172-1980(-)
MLTLGTLLAASYAPSPRSSPWSPARRVQEPLLAEFDVNAAVTRLNAAVEREDYAAAGRIKAEIEAGRGSSGAAVAPLVWDASALPAWLLARVEDLGFRFPTPVQAGALAARRSAIRDTVLSAPTGSGKTLAFSVRLVVEVAEQLEERASLATAAVSALLEEAPGGLSPTEAMGALSPALLLPGRDESGDATLPARGPPAGLVVAPTASLAEQAARLLHSLVGGYSRESRTYDPGAKDSLFKFGGPKAVRVAALFTAEEGAAAAAAAASGAGPLRDSELLVATPAAVAAAGESLDLSALRIACVDEADACDGAALDSLPPAASRVLVGATLGRAVATAVESGRVAPPVLVDGGGEVRSWAEDDLAQALCPAGIEHRFCVAPESGDQAQAQLQLLALARLLRNDLREWARLGGADHPRPRAVVFTSDAAAAVRVGAALRDSLWGEQAVATRAGEKDGEVGAAAFKSKRGNAGKDDFESVVRAGGASVLVVPRAEGRGLDFPDVTHVYCFNLGLGEGDANEYAHLAGRTGRVGQAGQGIVTSVLNADPDWPVALSALTAIVCVVARDTTGRSLEAVAVPSLEEDEDVRKGLDDLLALTEEREPSE